MIYLEHHATTPIVPAVRETMLPCLTDEWDIPSSSHRFWGQTQKDDCSGKSLNYTNTTHRPLYGYSNRNDLIIGLIYPPPTPRQFQNCHYSRTDPFNPARSPRVLEFDISFSQWLIGRTTIMAGYSGTPLWKKLGYKHGLAVCLDGAPDQYREWLDLPADVEIRWLDQPAAGAPFVHLFATTAARLKTGVKSWRKQIAPDGVIWVSWPKQSSGVATDITENLIREVALPTGLVDIKVCAVNEVWSGLKLMIRRELRQTILDLGQPLSRVPR